MAGRFGGRGRGGRGDIVARKRPSNEMYEKEGELSDTTSSPAKKNGTAMEEDGDTNKEKGGAAHVLIYPDEDETNLEVDDGGKGTLPVIDPHMVPHRLRDKNHLERRRDRRKGQMLWRVSLLKILSWRQRRPPRRTAGPNEYHVF
jgi:hypothetical protein